MKRNLGLLLFALIAIGCYAQNKVSGEVYLYKYSRSEQSFATVHSCVMDDFISNGNIGKIRIELNYAKGTNRSTAMIHFKLVDFRTTSSLAQWRKKIETAGIKLSDRSINKTLLIDNQCYFYFDNAKLKIEEGQMRDDTDIWSATFHKSENEMNCISLGVVVQSTNRNIFENMNLKKIEFDGRTYEIECKTAATIQAMFNKIFNEL